MMSRHMEREIGALATHGTIETGAPVPGCFCYRCRGVMAGAKHDPDHAGIRCPLCKRYRATVRHEDRAYYQCENCGTRSGLSWHCSELGDEWFTLPRALPQPATTFPARGKKEQPVLNIEAARAVPIRQVAAQLGIIANRAGYARCPFHEDRTPSFHINDRKGAAFCNPCGKSWDAIALTMAMRGVPFADAVRELAA